MANDGLVLYLGIYDTPGPRRTGFRGDRRAAPLGPRRHLRRGHRREGRRRRRDHAQAREADPARRPGPGIGVGAVLGLLFPPSIIVGGVVGGVAGGLTGHLWRGLSRADVKELGETLDGATPPCSWSVLRSCSSRPSACCRARSSASSNSSTSLTTSSRKALAQAEAEAEAGRPPTTGDSRRRWCDDVGAPERRGGSERREGGATLRTARRRTGSATL